MATKNYKKYSIGETPIQVESAIRDGSGKNIENNYAKQNGYYDSLTSGLSNNLNSNMVLTDTDPYLFRTAGGSLEIGDTSKVSEIRGNYNQTLAPVNNTTTAYQKSVPSGAISVMLHSIKGASYKYGQLVDTNTTTLTLESGKKYLTIISGVKSITTGDGTSISVSGGTDQIFDLTSDFGAGNEPTSVSDARTAYLARGVNIDEYNAYSQPIIRDTKVSKVDVVGFNKFNANAAQITAYGTATINGTQISVTGTYYAGFRVNWLPGTYYIKYTLVSGSYNGVRFHYDDNSLSEFVTSGQTITATKRITDVYLYCATGSTATVVYDEVCINISDNTLNGTYKPYFHRELEIPSAVQQMTNYGKGINSSVCSMLKFVVDEENNVLKVYLVENINVVDLGTLDWAYNENGGFVVNSTNMEALGIKYGLCELMCPKYTNLIINNSCS